MIFFHEKSHFLGQKVGTNYNKITVFKSWVIANDSLLGQLKRNNYWHKLKIDQRALRRTRSAENVHLSPPIVINQVYTTVCILTLVIILIIIITWWIVRRVRFSWVNFSCLASHRRLSARREWNFDAVADIDLVFPVAGPKRAVLLFAGQNGKINLGMRPWRSNVHPGYPIEPFPIWLRDSACFGGPWAETRSGKQPKCFIYFTVLHPLSCCNQESPSQH